MLDKIADISLAIDLNVDEDVIVDRITKRRICKQCNEVYHLDNRPPKKANVCDKCGGELYQRTDDTEKVVRERLRVYKEHTLPLTKMYGDRGILINVDGMGGIDAVFNRIISSIKKGPSK